jgi:hypothetical protein
MARPLRYQYPGAAIMTLVIGIGMSARKVARASC